MSTGVRTKRLPAVILGALLALSVLPGSAQARPIGDTTLFARVPSPGFGEGTALWGTTMFVGTYYGLAPNVGDPPSKIFMYDTTTRKLTGSITVTGQNLRAAHGVLGMVLDGRGRLYAGEEQLGVLRFTRTKNGWMQETYASLPNLPQCAVGSDPCSPTRDDRGSLPNDMTFDTAGNLYVADSWQATIWRVSPGRTRRARIWFQDARLDYLYGPNGIRVTPDGRRIVVAVTGPDSVAIGPVGKPPAIYSLPLVATPQASELRLFHEFRAPDGPDGIGFGASGKLYASSITSNSVVVISPRGDELARWPDPAANVTSGSPYDSNSTFVFNDARRTILIVNHVLATGYTLPQHNLVLEAFVNDTGSPLPRPVVP